MTKEEEATASLEFDQALMQLMKKVQALIAVTSNITTDQVSATDSLGFLIASCSITYMLMNKSKYGEVCINLAKEAKARLEALDGQKDS